MEKRGEAKGDVEALPGAYRLLAGKRAGEWARGSKRLNTGSDGLLR